MKQPSQFMVFLALIGLAVLSLTSRATADILTIGIGLDKPPYVIQADDNGLEADIVREALAYKGHEVEFRYLPLRRIVHAMNTDLLDGAMHLKKDLPIKGFFGDPMIEYHNYAITQVKGSLELDKIADLKGHRVVAFQNAYKYLGVDYQQAIDAAPNYSEMSNQELQVRMLAANRVDVVIADYRIFLHFKKRFEKETAQSLAVKFHPLFKPNIYCAAFKSQQIRDDFNTGLKWLRETGRYEEIALRYLNADDLRLIPRS